MPTFSYIYAAPKAYYRHSVLAIRLNMVLICIVSCCGMIDSFIIDTS